MQTTLVQLRTPLLLSAALLLAAVPAAAEQPRLPRGDASVTVGWLHADVAGVSEPYDSWASRRATLNGQAGLYWTEHWKTEFAAERSNRQARWQSITVPQPEGTAFRIAEHQVQDTRASFGQFYQFGHNAWTHLSFGGGLTIMRRNTISDIRPLSRHDRSGEVILEPGRTERTDETRASAFAAAALKAYVIPRAFVRTDVQADFRNRLEAVVLRIGVGVDF
jgi:hypothetical protein